MLQLPWHEPTLSARTSSAYISRTARSLPSRHSCVSGSAARSSSRVVKKKRGGPGLCGTRSLRSASIIDCMRWWSVGHGEHAKGFPSEMLLVLFRGMRGEIGEHLAFEACLQKIGAGDGHCAAVDLDHEGMAGIVWELQPEDEVGEEANLVHDSLVRELDAQGERIARGARLLRKSGDDVVGMDELHVASSASGKLQRDREIDDLQLMLDERAAGLAVLAAPFDVGELDAVALDQQSRATVGECVGDRR